MEDDPGQQATKLPILFAASETIRLLANHIEENSSDDDEMELQAMLVVATSQIKEDAPPRIKNYIDTVVDRHSDRGFQDNFRMPPIAFYQLLERLQPYLIAQTDSNRPTIDPKHQLLAVIWLLATPESYRSVGERFDMAKSTLWNCFDRVVEALNKIAHTIIKWPMNEEKEQIKASFAASARLQGVVGAIDGTYVQIKAPKEDGQRYVNRKCFHGITLQAVATPKLKFTDCFTGYPSSVGDRRIFTNSPLYKAITENTQNYFDENEYIIGDKAYPVLSWCIPPYINRGNLTNNQTTFNTRHAKTRQVVERSFALLFGRFRRLKYLDMNRVDMMPKTILACCVLHNICLDFKDLLVPQYIADGLEAVNGEISEPNEMETRQGIHRRDALARS